MLFCWEDDRPPHPDTITRRFKKLAAAAGLPEIDLHDVRHSYATAGQVSEVAAVASFGGSGERAYVQCSVPRWSKLGAMGARAPCVTCDVIIRLHQAGR